MRTHRPPSPRRPRGASLLGASLLGASLLGASLLGCGSGNWNINIEGREKTIVVPSAASAAPAYASDGSPPPRRYVVRMSDGSLDWEVELPEVATGYELRIPFKPKGQREQVGFGDAGDLTDADRQLIESMRRREPTAEGEGVYDGAGAPLDGRPEAARPQNAAPTPARQSYLKGVEKARALFQAGKYELALIALKSLDEQYPDDLQIKSMLGTLWLQLNQPELARETWEAGLRIDPQNRMLVEALKQLNRPEGASAPRADDRAGDRAGDSPTP